MWWIYIGLFKMCSAADTLAYFNWSTHSLLLSVSTRSASLLLSLQLISIISRSQPQRLWVICIALLFTSHSSSLAHTRALSRPFVHTFTSVFSFSFLFVQQQTAVGHITVQRWSLQLSLSCAAMMSTGRGGHSAQKIEGGGGGGGGVV